MFWTSWRSHGSLDEVLLPGSILLCFSLVELRICGSISVRSGHGCSVINQLREGGSADQTVLICVGVHEQLQERLIHLGMRIALLVIDGLLHEPDEVFLGLVESV